jgi:hypothetical protein
MNRLIHRSAWKGYSPKFAWLRSNPYEHPSSDLLRWGIILTSS